MIRTSIVLIPLIALIVSIPVLMGVYVYRDATRRRMNAVLWTLVAVLAPSFIGFIIYLLARESHSDLECPKCGASVEEQYVVCLGCGARLRPACPKCGAPSEPGWNVCPVCAAPLGEACQDYAAPIRHKDKGLWKILACVVALPLLLISTVAIGGIREFSGTGGVCGMRELSVDEYYEEQSSQTVRERVEEWLEQHNEWEHAYALRYTHAAGGENEYFYLVYIPGAGNPDHTSLGASSGMFGTVLSLEVEATGDSGSLFCLQYTGKEQPKLKITLDGKKISCDMEDVEENPVIMFAGEEDAQ